MFNYKICETCKKKRFGVKRRWVLIPQVKEKVLSKKEICSKCQKSVQRAVWSSI